MPHKWKKLLAPQRADAQASVGMPFHLVYELLHGRAQQLMRGQMKGATLQPTALVHEAWLRIQDRRPDLMQRRGELLAYAATVMRNMLVDHARRRQRKQSFDPTDTAWTVLGSLWETHDQRLIDVLAVDQALVELAQFDPVMARAVEMRFFGGLEFDAIAKQLDLPKRTLERHWGATRAWLFRRLS